MDNHGTFLQLVRLGVDKNIGSLPEYINWEEMDALATKQGLLGVLLDGIQRLADGADKIPYKKRLEWLGQVMQGYERRYVEYRKAIDALDAFYNTHGYKMMLLKGYACGRDWPRPEHRPYGDIDIWLFGKQKEADDVLVREKGIKIDNSHHHHTVFSWMGFTVENHYDFINIHHHRSNAELEKIFKKLGQDDGHYVEIGGERVYLPSPDLHALFLLKHLMSHFASERMTLRQLLDWAFFVEKRTKEIDWEWLLPIVENFHMKEFFNIINAICVEDLGFEFNFNDSTNLCSTSVAGRVSCVARQNENLSQLKERVLSEILSPEFSEKAPKNVLWRIPFKYRRWKANEWKHRLCYNESMHSAFWSGVKSHLLKPNSI